jgi:hypothetical protein
LNLELALEQLLFDRPLREAFWRGESVFPDLPAEELDALACLDREQLGRAARLACDGILRRAHRASGSLLDAFPRTISAWQSANPGATLEDLADDFAASPHFASYRALPTCEGAVCLEEGFLRFAEDAPIGDPITRKSECASAILKAIAVTASPSFALPSFVRQTKGGYFTIVSGGSEPLLFAVVGDKFVSGPIPPLLEALLA